MKRTLSIGLALTMMFMLLISTVSASDLLGIQNGKIQGEPAYKPSWWTVFWNAKPFSFVDTTVSQGNAVCTKTYTSGTLQHLSGSAKYAGASCSDGQYIAFKSVSGFKSGQYLFDSLWLKSNADNVLQWSNYDLTYETFDFTYSCYTCASASTSSSEPGCLSSDGTSCVKQSDSTCRTWYGYESVCQTHISSAIGGSGSGDSSSSSSTTATTSKIVLGDIAISKDGVDLELGKTYEIKGMAYAYGAVSNAVIETGFTGDYFQPLTITAVGTGKGVCGDDLTTGVKFTTTKADWIVFTLPIKPTTLGRQQLKIIASPGCGSGVIDSSKTVTLNVIAPATPTPIVEPTPTVSVDCTNTPTAPACLPPACTGTECTLDVCNDNCTGNTGIVTDENKPAPSWTDYINPLNGMIIILIVVSIVAGYLMFTRPKKGHKRHKR